MKRMLLVATLCAGAFLSGDRALAQMDSELQKTAAQRAAEAWLRLMDKGDYDGSWEQSASFFKDSVTREHWRLEAARIRVPAGPLVSRKFACRQYNERLQGAPDGQYLVLTYTSAFRENKKVAETVTAAFDKSRGWRVAGYKVESPKPRDLDSSS